MKKLFFAIISTFAINASADGCFYNFETANCEPVVCLNPLDYPDYEYLHNNYYGYEVGNVCNTISKTFLGILDAERKTDEIIYQKDKAIATRNKLISKLKRTCGSKCKNIR